MPNKYSKAPISELACGVYFKNNILINEAFIFDFIHKLKEQFPVLYTHPTFPEEEVINGILQQATNYEKAGFSSYRLTTQNNRLQVVIQQDLISAHWVRQDEENVGDYVGYSEISKLLFKLVEMINSKFEHLFESIKSYQITYIDRFNLSTYFEKGLTIFDIINIQGPTFGFNGKTYLANNFINRYSTSIPELNGYLITGINTPTFPNGQLMLVDNKLKGFTNDAIDVWFNKAHEIQLSIFESLFSKKILNEWV
jgi:uncharacterized protein (TIGR04255 family)